MLLQLDRHNTDLAVGLERTALGHNHTGLLMDPATGRISI
jgi:hypothetical protein